MRGQKMWSIIVWNVAGELVSPKYMTIGSQMPKHVLKAAFHWSPSHIRMLLYPHWMSKVEKIKESANADMDSLMFGRGALFLTV